MDEFAQSRADDDLFDDDILPIEAADEGVEVESMSKRVQDISLDSAPKGPSAGTNHYRGQDARGDKGRGRGGRGRGAERVNSRQQSSALLQSKYATASTQPDPVLPDTAPAAIPAEISKASESEPKVASLPATGSEDQSTSTPAPPTEPSTPARPPAVRGDRTGTGGIKKPKLTEEELTAKLAAAKTRSENLSAAHARAEADAASFAERERAAAQKRVKDAANRKVMEGEREKNRARKMAVMGGREWDAEKNEEDFRMASSGRGRGNYKSGANGGLRITREEPLDDNLRQYQWNEDRGGGRARGGRRGRGAARGAPSGRADLRSGATRQPDITTETDFPSLPGTTKTKDDMSTAKRPGQKSSSLDLLSPTAEPGSWADQVEVSEAAKPESGP